MLRRVLRTLCHLIQALESVSLWGQPTHLPNGPTPLNTTDEDVRPSGIQHCRTIPDSAARRQKC
eukprot:9321526-Pyramimonas_sp.AAC.1